MFAVIRHRQRRAKREGDARAVKSLGVRKVCWCVQASTASDGGAKLGLQVFEPDLHVEAEQCCWVEIVDPVRAMNTPSRAVVH